MKILIIEDEPSLRELIERAMRSEGYRTETAEDFISAETKLAGYNYDCILLDIMLPGGSGLDLLKRLRTEGRRENVIIISARDSVDDRVDGLELGADDYLPKPFHTSELVARVRSVLRRGRTGGSLTIDIGNISLDPASRRVTIDGRVVELLKKEFDILLYFMQRPEHLVDKAVLAEAVWGDYADESDNFHFVYAQIKNLRRKLEDAAADMCIRSVYGFGYKFSPVDAEK
ncbi:MAG: response regulator transcription factor [Alistipes sp.]|nr:response regulator transcription factor [Alistipes sp.]